MTTATPSATARGRFALRYSLRALLAVLTLACLGVAYWYRWPYAKEVIYPRQTQFLWAESAHKVYAGKEIQRYRRVLWGQPLREGLTEHFDDAGRRIGEDHWREDRLHGSCTRWYTNEHVLLRGQYHLGRQQGLWERFDDEGQLVLRAEYDRDLPHGTWRWYRSRQPLRAISFLAGEVTELDGQSVSDWLGKAIRSGKVEDADEAHRLSRLYTLDLPDAPLHVLISTFEYRSWLPVTMDPRCMSQFRRRVGLQVEHMPGNACWLVALAPTELAATYRYGGIWITSRSAAARSDATGVEELAAQARGTPLAAALDRPVQIALEEADAKAALQQLARTAGLTITVRNVRPSPPVTLECQLPAKHALGIILDHFELRVRTGSDWGLIVEPPVDAD